MRILNKMTGLVLASLLFATSCSEQDLLDLNVNQNAVEDIDMQYLFSLATLRIGGEYENTRANMLYAATMIQHTASTAGYFSGDKYFYSAQYSGAYMERHFTDVIDHRKGESPNTQVFQSAPKRGFGTSGSWWRSVGSTNQFTGRNSCPGRLSHRRWDGTD